ncbi:MAG: type II secretion system secretin GspD [Pontiella sp.]
MNYKKIFTLAVSIPALSILSVFGQGEIPSSPPEGGLQLRPTPPQTAPTVQRAPAPSQRGQLQTFSFETAPLEVVMEEYCRWTGKIFLKTDAVTANITLKANQLTTEESIRVVEAILAMNNIALVPMGDRYIKVIQATAGDLTGQGLDIDMNPETVLGSGDHFITKIIQLHHVEIPEVQAAVQHVMHTYGKIMGLQRSNSLMITDTEVNIRRALKIIEFIDQATAGIDSRIYQIEFAEAGEIATKLKEIIDAAQGEEPKPVVSGNPYARTPAGVMRATANQTQTQASISQTESGATTIINGEVKVLADERTNILIIFSREENFIFFDKIIRVLDIEVEPVTTFEIIHLEYADALDLSGTLNDLIGGVSSSRSSTSTSRTTNSRTLGSSLTTGSRVTPNATSAGDAALGNMNRLSEDTKILADERSNSIILMGRKSDISAIKLVIQGLDIMLAQVIIEAAIFEIGLSDSLRHGIDWLYRASDDQKVGAWDGNSLVGATNGLNSVASGALTYFQSISGINTELAISLAATDDNATLLSNPVIMTTDNTEASLIIGEQRPVITSTSTYNNSSGTSSSNYEYKDIGIQLTVTPRINPQRFVMMEVSQKADQIGGSVSIDGNEVPIILNREFEASIAVPDGGTIALGGLIQTEKSESITKIPILGNIPFIGRYLFSTVSETETQRELIVLMTPYVMTNMQEMQNETERLYKGSNMKQENWKGSWSESKLKYIPDPIEETEDEYTNSTPPAQPTTPQEPVQKTEEIVPVEPVSQPAPPSEVSRSEPSQSEVEEMMKMLEELN